MCSLESLRSKRGFICDMDGVIYHGGTLVPGAERFVQWLRTNNKACLFLTNNSACTRRELHQRLARLGIEVDEGSFYTSALATASFLSSQFPGGSVYVIGETGLSEALSDKGFSTNDTDPDYVVVGETRAYNYEKIERAVRCVLSGARLIGTNPDITGPAESGIVPACKALISPIELATGKNAYFVGKPNPLIMRQALKQIGCRREETVIIGDRMDTDIVAGIESEIDTVLVLTGVSSLDEVEKYPYRPGHVLGSVAEIAG